MARHLDATMVGDLRWTRATVSSVAAILKNPAYAGAFVYGRTRMRAAASEGVSRAKVPRPVEEWRIVVKDRYPAYIDWPTYEKIRTVIRDNRAEYMRTKTRGAPRDGDLLLHGIAWCARCGHKMYVRYKGGGEYVCNHLRSSEGLPTCQHIRAARIDAVVADALLTALAPAELDALSRAHRTQMQMDSALRTSAEHQLERKQYAAALAERQFNKVDPDNRLVAAELFLLPDCAQPRQGLLDRGRARSGCFGRGRTVGDFDGGGLSRADVLQQQNRVQGRVNRVDPAPHVLAGPGIRQQALKRRGRRVVLLPDLRTIASLGGQLVVFSGWPEAYRPASATTRSSCVARGIAYGICLTGGGGSCPARGESILPPCGLVTTGGDDGRLRSLL